MTLKPIDNEFLVRTLTIVDSYVNDDFLQSKPFFRLTKDGRVPFGNNLWCSLSPLQATAALSVSTRHILPRGKESSLLGC